MLTSKERYAQAKERRIEECLRTMSIDTDASGQTYAVVLSQSKVNQFYNVEIDETCGIPVARSCDCVGNAEHEKLCIHMIAVNRFFTRIYLSVEHTEITETVGAPEQVAREAVEQDEQMVEAYEQLAPTKATAGIAAVLAEREEHDKAGQASCYITASMNDPEKLAAQKDTIARERLTDYGERGSLNGSRGYSLLRQ